MAERIVIAELPHLTVSFGLATSDQAEDFDQVVALADAALLSAKAGGRDQIVVSTGPDRTAETAGGGPFDPADTRAGDAAGLPALSIQP